MNFKLAPSIDAENPVKGDIALVEGDLVLIDGDEAVGQHVLNRLRVFFREWYLDRRIGLPFYQEVFIKNPNRPAIVSLFRRVVGTTPGVSAVLRLVLSVDAQRNARIDFDALLDSGGRLEYRDLVLVPHQLPEAT